MHKKGNESEPQANPKPNFRSRVTAGLDLLPSIDGRSHWARIMRDTYHAMLAHAGGADHVPETKRLLARRIACLESELNIRRRFTIASPVAFPFARAMPVFLRRGRPASQDRFSTRGKTGCF